MATTYRGTVRNAVVVFDGPPPIADGTAVNIAPVARQDPAAPSDGGGAQQFRPVGSWDGPAGELEHLLADVQADRDADLGLERDAWK